MSSQFLYLWYSFYSFPLKNQYQFPYHSVSAISSSSTNNQPMIMGEKKPETSRQS
ncbi:hypothetical protein C0J52_26282 [Blattella germanica]|nr:hypothetical protein C0J52_26282 [Blattella germanica]